MTQAKALYEAGQLRAALDELVREVKANPADVSRRIFLFELSCFAGDWERAERQLDVIGHQSAENQLSVQVYRHNVKAERDRRRLFTEGLQPHFLREPPPYVDLHLAAINRVREGNFAEARRTLDRAEEERPALSGKCKGQQFQDFRDYDDMTGPVLELIVKDKYTWMPFEQVGRIEIQNPSKLRDMIWVPARVEALDGTVGEVYLPALYAGTSEHQNDQARLGRMTDWREIGEGLYAGVGVRVFLVGDEEKAIFELKEVEFDATAAPPQGEQS